MKRLFKAKTILVEGQYASHFLEQILFTYHLSIEPNFSFLHNSEWITFFTLSCLLLYSFLTSLMQSVIIICSSAIMVLLRYLLTRVGWWYFTGSCVRENLQTPELFSVFWSILVWCCSLDGFHSSSDFQLFQCYYFLFESFSHQR